VAITGLPSARLDYASAVHYSYYLPLRQGSDEMVITLIGVLAAESDRFTAAITAAGAITAAIATSVGTWIVAERGAKKREQELEQRERELKLTYEQKLQEGYLANARKHAESLYVPLNRSTYQLSRAYQSFRATTDLKTGKPPADQEQAFKVVFTEFLEQYNKLLEREGAYLTVELEQRLTSFTAFLETSLDAKNVVRRTVLSVSNSSFAITGASGIALLAAAKVLNFTPVIPFYFPVEAEIKIVAAPLTSRQFEERFAEDTARISSLIKEVTLRGQPVSPSP
jgi:hypothetical protein